MNVSLDGIQISNRPHERLSIAEAELFPDGLSPIVRVVAPGIDAVVDRRHAARIDADRVDEELLEIVGNGDHAGMLRDAPIRETAPPAIGVIALALDRGDHGDAG